MKSFRCGSRRASTCPPCPRVDAVESRNELGWSILPKRELVSRISVLLSTDRLKIASELALGETLRRAMLTFRATVRPSSSVSSARQSRCRADSASLCGRSWG